MSAYGHGMAADPNRIMSYRTRENFHPSERTSWNPRATSPFTPSSEAQGPILPHKRTDGNSPVFYRTLSRVWLGRYTAYTDVRRGTSGTSRDVPIFVQFYVKFVQLMSHKEKKKVAKNNCRFGEKYQERKTKKKE